MGLSLELQIGKAAEHLVCADLILQGCNAFLADQGMPYDVVVDTIQGLKRVQVKSTTAPFDLDTRDKAYRFGTRRAKRNGRKVSLDETDFYAFVALDIMHIAYLPVHLLRGLDRTSVVQCIEFRSKRSGCDPQISMHKSLRTMRFLEDYSRFPLSQGERVRFHSSSETKEVHPVGSLWNQEVE